MSKEKRIEKYEKTTNIGVKKIDALKPKMDKEYTKEATKLRNLDQKVSQILNKYGVIGNQRFAYINFARTIYKASLEYSGSALLKYIQSEYNKAIALNLNSEILTEIIFSIGLTRTMRPPSIGEFYHEFNTLGNWDMVYFEPTDATISTENGWLDVYSNRTYTYLVLAKNLRFREIEAMIYVPMLQNPSLTRVGLYAVKPNERTAIFGVHTFYKPDYGIRWGVITIYVSDLNRGNYVIIPPENWNATGILRARIFENKLQVEFNEIVVELEDATIIPDMLGIWIGHSGVLPIEDRAKIRWIRAR